MTDRPRILVILQPGEGGGQDRSIAEIMKGVAAAGAAVCVAQMGRGRTRGADFSEAVQVVGLRATRVRQAIPEVLRLARSFRPDWVHSAAPQAYLVAAVVSPLVGARRSVAAHNPVSQLFGGLTGVKRRAVLSLTSWALSSAATRIAVSQDVAADLVRTFGVARDRITVIPNPLDLEQIRSKARQPCPLSLTGDPLVVSVARLHRQKDPLTLLEAFALLRRRTSAELIMIGEGPLHEEVERRRVTLGLEACTQVPGHLDNPFPILQRADVFVQASRFEGFGRSIVEAATLGVPIVATDAPGGARVLLEDGRHGVLTPVGDAPAMAVAIQRQLTAPIVPRCDLRPFAPATAVRAYARLFGVAP